MDAPTLLLIFPSDEESKAFYKRLEFPYNKKRIPLLQHTELEKCRSSEKSVLCQHTEDIRCKECNEGPIIGRFRAFTYTDGEGAPTAHLYTFIDDKGIYKKGTKDVGQKEAMSKEILKWSPKFCIVADNDHINVLMRFKPLPAIFDTLKYHYDFIERAKRNTSFGKW